MALLDALLTFSRQQALSGTTAVVSTNIYDAGTDEDGNGKTPKLFGGTIRKAHLAIQVTKAGGTDPTFQAQFVGADNAALTTNPVVLADTGTSGKLAAGDLPALYELRAGLQTVGKRYYGVKYTLTGTSPTATVNAGIVEASQSNLVK